MPDPMAYEERARVRSAANVALRRYPGPIGVFLHKELHTWADFGYRLGGHQLVNSLVEEIMESGRSTEATA
jgi:hypothetical protein